MMTTKLPKQSNSSTSDPISNALDIPPLYEVLPKEEPKKEVVDVASQDYEYARGNLINVIEKGSEALDSLMDVAQQSQQPRAFEVIASLIKTIADTNKDLLELKKKDKEISNMDGNKGPSTVNNNLFVGSTAELQKLIKGNNVEE